MKLIDKLEKLIKDQGHGIAGKADEGHISAYVHMPARMYMHARARTHTHTLHISKFSQKVVNLTMNTVIWDVVDLLGLSWLGDDLPVDHRVWMLPRDPLIGLALESNHKSILGTFWKILWGRYWCNVKNIIVFLWGFIEKGIKAMRTSKRGTAEELQTNPVTLSITTELPADQRSKQWYEAYQLFSHVENGISVG